MYDSKIIANRLLELAGANGVSLTPMQALKLVYISHGWMLGLYHRPLIRDEVQAWQYGPVVPRLYNALRGYRGDQITTAIPVVGNQLDPSADSIVSQVYDAYGSMSGPALSRLTHATNTPWALTYVPGSFGIVIPQDLIEDHYSNLAARSLEQQASS